MEWQPIETAPKDGTEILAYRSDAGEFICRWATMEEVVPKDQYGDPIEEYDEDFEGWWHDAFGWLEGSESPTYWSDIPRFTTPTGDKP